MISDKRLKIKILLILVLIVIALGTSYAYFTAVVTGNEEGSTILVNAGELTIRYDNLSDVITVNDVYPREEAWVRKEFTLTGNNDTDEVMYYTIGLAVDSTTFTPNSLSYKLIGENTSNNGEIASDNLTGTILNGVNYFTTGYFLKGEDMVHKYTLEIYYKDNGKNQNANQGASFTSHIILNDIDLNNNKNGIALSKANLSSIGYTDNVVPSNLIIPNYFSLPTGEWNTVNSIVAEAFIYDTTLTSLTLNEGLESIGESAFYNATNLTGNITIPSTVKTIGRNAFQSTGITGLTLNEGLESIGERAFDGVSNLTGTLTIPSTVKTIGSGAFYGTGITNINYRGSEADWSHVIVNMSNVFPEGITINYNYTGE